MRLDDRVDPELSAGRDEIAQLGVFESLGDEKHRVSASGTRLVHLITIDNDVLREDRHIHRGTDRAQVIQRAAPVARLGQDRDRPSACSDVPTRLRCGIHVLCEHAERRGDPFHFGDDGDVCAIRSERRVKPIALAR